MIGSPDAAGFWPCIECLFGSRGPGIYDPGGQHLGFLTWRHRMQRKSRGFTLVEILIVVIILGILAAIVIPQFTNASNDARKSNLSSQLQTLRAQIELYKLQHKETVPLLITGGGGMWKVFTE